jgi:hypothetical protein
MFYANTLRQLELQGNINESLDETQQKLALLLGREGSLDERRELQGTIIFRDGSSTTITN